MIPDAPIDTRLFEKALNLNLYLYLPAHSAHAPGTLDEVWSNERRGRCLVEAALNEYERTKERVRTRTNKRLLLAVVGLVGRGLGLGLGLGSLKGLIRGMFLRIQRLTSDLAARMNQFRRLYVRLRARGYPPETLSPLFATAVAPSTAARVTTAPPLFLQCPLD
jgi:hypothetical protein